MDINQLCARKIRYLREFNNFTQGYVADELEMSQNAYSLLEKGTTKITIDRLVSIAKIYHTTPSELLKENYNENSFTPPAILIQDNNTKHSNYPPALSELEKLMYEQTIIRLETSIERLYDLIGKLTSKIADPSTNNDDQHSVIMRLGKTKE